MLQKNETKVLLLKKHSHSKCVSYCTWHELQKIWVNFSQKNQSCLCGFWEYHLLQFPLLPLQRSGQEPSVPIRRNISCLCSCCKVGIMECLERNRKENKERKKKQIGKKTNKKEKSKENCLELNRKENSHSKHLCIQKGLGILGKIKQTPARCDTASQTGNRNPSACREVLGHKRKF